MSDAPLASLSLTHVHYDPADPISYMCAWLALVPQGLCLTYVVLIWSTREVEVALMFAGQMGCEALNFLLKRLIKEERPERMFGKGYGMPSSHAQFLSFFSVYLALFLLLRHKPTTKSSVPAPPIPLPPIRVQYYIFSFLLLVFATLVSASRIYLSYHTPKQVLVGNTAGALCGVAWYCMVEWIRSSGWLHYFLEFRLSRMLRVRDLVIEEDLVEAGWREWNKRRDTKVAQTAKTK